MNEHKWTRKIEDLDYSARAVIFEKTLIITGGNKKSTTWLVTFDGKKHTQGAPMISERGFHGTLAFREFVWVFCGTEGHSHEITRDSGSSVEYYLTRCEQYNVIHNTWVSIE